MFSGAALTFPVPDDSNINENPSKELVQIKMSPLSSSELWINSKSVPYSSSQVSRNSLASLEAVWPGDIWCHMMKGSPGAQRLMSLFRGKWAISRGGGKQTMAFSLLGVQIALGVVFGWCFFQPREEHESPLEDNLCYHGSTSGYWELFLLPACSTATTGCTSHYWYCK